MKTNFVIERRSFIISPQVGLSVGCSSQQHSISSYSCFEHTLFSTRGRNGGVSVFSTLSIISTSQKYETLKQLNYYVIKWVTVLIIGICIVYYTISANHSCEYRPDKILQQMYFVIAIIVIIQHIFARLLKDTLWYQIVFMRLFLLITKLNYLFF